MGNFLSQSERETVRVALSDAFVDNDVDYKAIAKAVSQFNWIDVEEIFFSEVAPVCDSNLSTPAPQIWTAFEPVSLNMAIEKMLAARRDSFWTRQKDKVLVQRLRHKYADIWKSILQNLHNPS